MLEFGILWCCAGGIIPWVFWELLIFLDITFVLENFFNCHMGLELGDEKLDQKNKYSNGLGDFNCHG